MHDQPTGFCQCGCGQRTKPAKKHDGQYKRGEYRRFLLGHNQRTNARPIRDRIMEKVEIDANGCWLWTGTIDTRGYGTISYIHAGRRTWNVYRLAYELLRGPIPEGLELDHLCRNRACLNPEHLEPVTHEENMRRSAPAQRTHCKRGHEYTPENTEYGAKGWRNCRTCRREILIPRATAKAKAKREAGRS
jgi:hypothetical protein